MILGVSIPAFFVAMFIENPKLRTLAFLLVGFLLLHGLYHATAVLSSYYDIDFLEFLSLSVAQPLSYLVLALFAYKLYKLGDTSHERLRLQLH